MLKSVKKLGDLGVDRRIILKLIFSEKNVRMWTGFICLMVQSSGWHLFENCEGLSVSTKDGEFLEHANDSQFLKDSCTV
jgi:hypothetical protein